MSFYVRVSGNRKGFYTPRLVKVTYTPTPTFTRRDAIKAYYEGWGTRLEFWKLVK